MLSLSFVDPDPKRSWEPHSNAFAVREAF